MLCIVIWFIFGFLKIRLSYIFLICFLLSLMQFKLNFIICLLFDIGILWMICLMLGLCLMFRCVKILIGFLILMIEFMCIRCFICNLWYVLGGRFIVRLRNELLNWNMFKCRLQGVKLCLCVLCIWCMVILLILQL